MKTSSLLIIGLFLIAMLSVSTVEASGQTIYTSTADFDSGNKSDPGQDYFVSNGVDQPTYSMISKPAGIYVSANQRTYVVYQGGAFFLPYIVYYDHSLRQWSNAAQVNDTNPVSGDGHGAPSMWIDADGFIYVIYGAHATAFQLKRSSVPYEITSWVQLASPTPGSPPSNQATYPHFFEHDGYIYLFYRQSTAADGVWGFRRSNDHGETWSSYTTTINFGTNGTYVSDVIYVPSLSRAYYVFVMDDRTIIYRRNAYVCYWNLINNNQIGINGANLGPFVDQTEADLNCRAAFTFDGQSWTSNMRLDASNNPHVLFVNGTGIVYDTYNITYVFWNGSVWSSQIILTNTDGLSSYTDMILRSSTDIDAFIVTSGFQQLSGLDDFSGDLEKWHWNGTAWSYIQTIMTEAKAGNPVNRPFVPYNHRDEIQIVFDSWLPKDLLLAEAKMWAWGSNGLVHRIETPSDTLGVETITDNLNVASGSFVLANGLSDTFTTNSTDASSYKLENARTGDGDGTFLRRFVNGVFNASASGFSGAGTGRLGSTLRSNYGITGAIDARAKFAITDTEDVSGSLFSAMCLFNQPDECDSVSGSYYAATSGVYYIRTNTDTLEAASVINGTPALIGSGSSVTCEPCWLRITRSGTTFTFYYSTNGIDWTQDEQTTIAALIYATWYIHMSLFSNGIEEFGETWAMTVDDFQLSTGSLDSDGYRKTGKWDTPLVTFNDEVVKTVTINYTGATAGRFIDQIAVIDNTTGNVLVSEDANWTSGTIATFTIMDNDLFSLHGKDWRIRVSLIGDGSGSVVITDVTVNTVRSPIAKAIGDGPWILGFVALITLGLMGAFWFKKKRGG